MVIDNIKKAISEPTSEIQMPTFALEIISSGKVSGFIASPTFYEMDETARQDRIWTVLRRKLSQEDLASISMLLAVTYDEMDDDSKIQLK